MTGWEIMASFTYGNYMEAPKIRAPFLDRWFNQGLKVTINPSAEPDWFEFRVEA